MYLPASHVYIRTHVGPKLITREYTAYCSFWYYEKLFKAIFSPKEKQQRYTRTSFCRERPYWEEKTTYSKPLSLFCGLQVPRHRYRTVPKRYSHAYANLYYIFMILIATACAHERCTFICIGFGVCYMVIWSWNADPHSLHTCKHKHKHRHQPTFIFKRIYVWVCRTIITTSLQPYESRIQSILQWIDKQ